MLELSSGSVYQLTLRTGTSLGPMGDVEPQAGLRPGTIPKKLQAHCQENPSGETLSGQSFQKLTVRGTKIFVV